MRPRTGRIARTGVISRCRMAGSCSWGRRARVRRNSRTLSVLEVGRCLVDSRRQLGALVALGSLLVIASTSVQRQTDVKTARAQLGLSTAWAPPRTPDG